MKSPAGWPWWTAIPLAGIAAVALALRIGVSYHVVFADDPIPDLPVRFIENDAWYHMRLVDATVQHFPRRIWFDRYLVFPGGEPVDAGPFFDWVIAGAALVAGRGAPSTDLVDIVGAYTPVVFGALFPFPVYVLGKRLFSRRAGLWAALIVAILPGQILMRSALGYTDHHCAEILLTTTALMWIVLALDPAMPRRRRLTCSTAAGVMLGCYLLTWSGGSLFVVLIVASAAASLVIDRLRGAANGDLPLVLLPALAVPAVMIIPWLTTRPYFGYDGVALVGGLALLVALEFWGRLADLRTYGPVTYAAGLAGAAGCGVTVVAFLHRDWLGLAWEIGRLSPWRPAGYVAEAAPLLKSAAMRPLPLWNEFGACLALACVGVAWFAARSRASSASGLLLVVWTIVMLAMTFGQVRFTYYLGVNVALFAGFACDETLLSIETRWPRVRRAAAIAILFLVTVPVGDRLYAIWGSQTSVSDAWFDALRWLRSNSPEPFAGDDVFYRTDVTNTTLEGPGAGGYGVLAWWDYGYWITRIAHRIPNANPKQTQVADVAAFLLAETPQEASAVLKRLRSRYVIVDGLLQARIPVSPGRERNGYFSAIAKAAGQAVDAYCASFETSGSGRSPTTQVYCFPKYYRTMVVRLYAFGGRRVVPPTVSVISWTEQTRGDLRVRVLAGQESFGSFEEAERFMAARPSERWEMASADPLTSCVELEELPEYRRVFQSLWSQSTLNGGVGPALVQIYEYYDPS